MVRLLWALCLTFPAGAAVAQPPDPVTLDLGVDVAGPGDKVSLPLTLTVPGGYTVRKISLLLSFPSERLSFQGAVLSAAAKKAETTIETTLDKENAESTVRLDLAANHDMTTGELLKLSLTISSHAKADEEIPVKNLKQSAHDAGGREIGARGADGMVRVLTAAFFGCFFYMH